MRIGEFSRETGLPVSTLHFYERKGLIAPLRNEAGHREYGDADLAWVAFIERLKETGMPLAQIKMYADLRERGDSTLRERMGMLVEHRRALLATIGFWQESLEQLDAKIKHYDELIQRDTHEKHAGGERI